MEPIFAITRKELNRYFGSPMALIFIGVFLAATLFTFFWLDTFFARGIADVRPLFRWMPILLIFLVASLTMRQWSEEAQSGTLEILLTLPVQRWQLVLGKFLAVMALIGVSLLLTLGLPITVSILGNLDWGPVVGGYLAALLMASSFAALGLFVSSQTRNEIVALIITVVVGGVLHLIGTRAVTEFFGDSVGTLLRAISTGSRFDSIERGVIDIRDLSYYLSIAAIFLTLNVLALDVRRWSSGASSASYRRRTVFATVLVVLNLVVVNVWLYPLAGARLDLTEGRLYSLSDVTKRVVTNLQEPLLLRAYFSERTHPLLAPLAPRIEDMLREYEIASNGRVVVEIVDPIQNPDLEAEANQSYGIRPTPFQVAGRYESSVVNAYFDILIRYGSQSEVLNFRDLIEVEAFRDGEVDVRLRNLEYDLTRTIQKVVYGFQDISSILQSIPQPVDITLYNSPATLPEELGAVPDAIQQVVTELQESADNLTFQIIDPTEPTAAITPQELFDQYGLQPFAVSLFDSTSYYLHMIVHVGDQAQIIYPSADAGEVTIRSSIESALKRFSVGFLKVVGIWTPTIPPDPMMVQLGQTQQPPFSTWNTLEDILRQEYEVRSVDLTTGRVASDIDVLIIVAPQGMTDAEHYAVDQFLMRGGAVIVAANNHRVTVDPFTAELKLEAIEGGIQDMLQHYGVEIGDAMVMDPQNEPFPITVNRNVGGFNVQEIQSIDYPYFVEIRADGMATDSPIIANLPAVTLNWVSPVTVTDPEQVDASALMQSTAGAWLRDDLNIQPNTELYPELGFPVGDERASYPLAVSVIGKFDSYFAGRSGGDAENSGEQLDIDTSATLQQSPENTRLVVIGSGDFLNDTVFEISSQISLDRYRNNLQFVQNSVDWTVEDLELLNIRTRGTSNRTLATLEREEQTYWEFINYAIALISLLVVGILWSVYRRNEKPMQLSPSGVGLTSKEVSVEQA